MGLYKYNWLDLTTQIFIRPCWTLGFVASWCSQKKTLEQMLFIFQTKTSTQVFKWSSQKEAECLQHVGGLKMHQLWPQEVLIQKKWGKVLLYSCRKTASHHCCAQCWVIYSFPNLTIWMIPVSPFFRVLLPCLFPFCSITSVLLLRTSFEGLLCDVTSPSEGKLKFSANCWNFESSLEMLLQNVVINQ